MVVMEKENVVLKVAEEDVSYYKKNGFKKSGEKETVKKTVSYDEYKKLEKSYKNLEKNNKELSEKLATLSEENKNLTAQLNEKSKKTESSNKKEEQDDK